MTLHFSFDLSTLLAQSILCARGLSNVFVILLGEPECFILALTLVAVYGQQRPVRQVESPDPDHAAQMDERGA